MDELKLSGVSKHFGGVTALEDVWLSLRKGETLGLIGPNGSGKTTLVNLVTGHIRASAGRFSCEGETWESLPPHAVARRRIVRTFQTVRPSRELTVKDSVQFAARRSRFRRASIEHVLSSLSLWDFRHEVPTSLPLDLQRRVEIARALALKPHYLWLDEPAAGLTEVEVDYMRDLIRLIRSEYGCGIGIIDHTVSFIMDSCDRLVVLDEGRVIGEGTPNEIRQNPEVRRAYLGELEAGGTER